MLLAKLMDFNQYTAVIIAENKSSNMDDEKIISFENEEVEVEKAHFDRLLAGKSTLANQYLYKCQKYYFHRH